MKARLSPVPSLPAQAPQARPQPAPESTGPVELTREQLEQVAGGGPNGTWVASSDIGGSLSGPNGTW